MTFKGRQGVPAAHLFAGMSTFGIGCTGKCGGRRTLGRNVEAMTEPVSPPFHLIDNQKYSISEKWTIA
ncbi:MAG: hypothetical protein ACI855_002553 [Myxococcota bacterium]|jgi:hypothetical protein